MVCRRNSTNVAPLFLTAALTYAANCGLGIAVATKLIDTTGFRWLHHALYIATCTTTAAAIVTAWWAGGRRTRRAALALIPTALPLSAIAYVETQGRRHPLVALAAAPFFAASLALARRPADRK